MIVNFVRVISTGLKTEMVEPVIVDLLNEGAEEANAAGFVYESIGSVKQETGTG